MTTITEVEIVNLPELKQETHGYLYSVRDGPWILAREWGDIHGGITFKILRAGFPIAVLRENDGHTWHIYM